VEDWERHFAEKSRRRADKEWRERQRRRADRLLIGAGISAALIGSIAALAALR
jgi:hypothetical protein